MKASESLVGRYMRVESYYSTTYYKKQYFYKVVDVQGDRYRVYIYDEALDSWRPHLNGLTETTILEAFIESSEEELLAYRAKRLICR